MGQVGGPSIQKGDEAEIEDPLALPASPMDWHWAATVRYRPSYYVLRSPRALQKQDTKGWVNLLDVNIVAQKGDWFISPFVQFPLTSLKDDAETNAFSVTHESREINFDIVVGRYFTDHLAFFAGWRAGFSDVEYDTVSKQAGRTTTTRADFYEHGPVFGITYGRTFLRDDIVLTSDLRISPLYVARSDLENISDTGEVSTSDALNDYWFFDLKVAANYDFAPGWTAGLGFHVSALSRYDSGSGNLYRYGPMIQLQYVF